MINKPIVKTIPLETKPVKGAAYKYFAFSKFIVNHKGKIRTQFGIAISKVRTHTDMKLYLLSKEDAEEFYLELNSIKNEIQRGRESTSKTLQFDRRIKLDKITIEIVPKISKNNRNIGIKLAVFENDSDKNDTFILSILNTEVVKFVSKIIDSEFFKIKGE